MKKFSQGQIVINTLIGKLATIQDTDIDQDGKIIYTIKYLRKKNEEKVHEEDLVLYKEKEQNEVLAYCIQMRQQVGSSTIVETMLNTMNIDKSIVEQKLTKYQNELKGTEFGIITIVIPID